MKEYIIRWNIGYGDDYELIDAKDQEEAEKIAYEMWRDEVENSADYEAMEATEELKEDYGL